jgi:hypothetical protein
MKDDVFVKSNDFDLFCQAFLPAKPVQCIGISKKEFRLPVAESPYDHRAFFRGSAITRSGCQ